MKSSGGGSPSAASLWLGSQSSISRGLQALGAQLGADSISRGVPEVSRLQRAQLGADKASRGVPEVSRLRRAQLGAGKASRGVPRGTAGSSSTQCCPCWMTHHSSCCVSSPSPLPGVIPGGTRPLLQSLFAGSCCWSPPGTTFPLVSRTQTTGVGSPETGHVLVPSCTDHLGFTTLKTLQEGLKA